MATNPFEQFGYDQQPASAPVTPQPIRIQGSPRMPSPQTPAQARTDALQADKLERDAARSREGTGVASFYGSANEGFDNAAKLRTELDTSPASKTYREALPSYAAALQAEDTPAGDLNLIYAYAKIMDPNSVVRESEAASVASVGTLPQSIQGAVRKQFESTGRLTPEIRNTLKRELQIRLANYNRAYTQARERSRELARTAGLDPDLVVGQHAGDAFATVENRAFHGDPNVNAAIAGQRASASGQDQPPPLGPGDIGFSGAPPTPDSPLTPQQQAAYDAFNVANPQATAAQLRAFGSSIGVSIDNADQVVEARCQGLGVLPATSAILAPPKDAREMADRVSAVEGAPGVGTLLNQGATLGLSDEAAGIGNAAANALVAPFSSSVDFDPAASYQLGRDAERIRIDQARKNSGWLGTGAEILSGVATANPTSVVRAAPTLLARMGQGARAGAAGGALAGYGYGEGATGSALSAGAGAAIGAGAGAAIPALGQFAGDRVRGVNRLLGRDPALPRQLVGDALAADNIAPREAGALMDEAHRLGVPRMLADSGDNTRQLLASVARQPGPSRTIAREAVIGRQEGQADRISNAIERDLGPASNPYEVADRLSDQARQTAAPIYEQAYAGPTPSPERVRNLLNRPSMRDAMKNAYRLAAEEERDPTKLGFDLDQYGEVVLAREPSMQTLDYVKRGMDDVIEGYRDKTSGKLRLDTRGRAVNNTLRSFLGLLDEANPAYAQARAAYGGPTAARDALQLGLKSLNQGADDITARTARMTPFELDMYRLGVRRAMVDRTMSQVDGANKIRTLVGSPRRRQALERVFGGRAEFQRFIDTLQHEQAGSLTYGRFANVSPTAEFMAQDAATNDTGLARAAVEVGVRGVRDGPLAAIADLLGRLRDGSKFGVGKAGEETRARIAQHLVELDSAAVQELITAARKANASQRIGRKRGTLTAINVGGHGGKLIGKAAGALSSYKGD